MKVFIDFWIILALTIFIFLYLPFIQTIPYLDGNIEFVLSNIVYKEGISGYLKNQVEYSVHPPLKFYLASLFFKVFGQNQVSYNLVGLFFGLSGVLGIYCLGKEMGNRNIGRQSALLLSLSPLFIANALFSLKDFIIAVLIIFSLLFYSRKKYLLSSGFSCLAVMTKETALIFPFSILLVELFFFLKNLFQKKKVKIEFSALFFLLPFFFYFLWCDFLIKNNQKPWGDWIFAETASRGALYTALYNFFTLKLFNKYAFQHWRQLFILNFNWIFWLILLSGVILYFRKKENQRFFLKEFLKGTDRFKTFSVILIFLFGYLLSVLSFPTFTIPRYGLPIIPFFLIGVSFSIWIITKDKKTPFRFFFISCVIFVNCLSLFTSVDLVSKYLWKKVSILGQEIYNLKDHLAGNDGITYNFQFLLIAKNRTEQILNFEKSTGIFYSKECGWIFPDPRNDFVTFQILFPQIKECREPS